MTIPSGADIADKLDPSNIISGNVKWYSHFGNCVGNFLDKLSIQIKYSPTIVLLGVYLR